MEEEKEFRIEDAFTQLEQMIETLESDSLSLKDSIVLYGEGAKLLLKCKEELEGIEKR